MGHGGSKKTVVGVGDADGAGIRDKTSVFFGDEKEEAVIVLRRRGLPSAERRDDSKKEGGSKIGRGTPSSEGDPVGTRARIVGVLDGGEDGLEGGGRNEEGVNKLRVGVEWRGAHISDQKLEATAAFPLSSKRGGSEGETRREEMRVLEQGSLSLRMEIGLVLTVEEEVAEEKARSLIASSRPASRQMPWLRMTRAWRL